MTREEERHKAAKEFAFSDKTETSAFYNVMNDFYYGAKWADEHPNRRLVYTKQELRTMGFGFDLNGNIVTLDEMNEMVKRGNEYRKSKLIEKACDFLVHNMPDSTYLGANTLTSLHKAEFIQRFKEVMEE